MRETFLLYQNAYSVVYALHSVYTIRAVLTNSDVEGKYSMFPLLKEESRR